MDTVKTVSDKGPIKSKKSDGDEIVLNEELGTNALSNESKSESKAEEDDSEFPKKAEDCDRYFTKFWQSFSPPNDESTYVGKRYAVVYSTRKKSILFIARAKRRFLQNDSVSGIEMD